MMKPSNIVHKHPFSIPVISKLTKLASTLAIALAASSTLSIANAQEPHPGEALFKTRCTMCHGQAGEGIAVFPPLAESEWVNGPAENLVRIQLRGLMGPITVKGKEYNGMMPANAAMTDQEIADVLTYVRSHLGNKAPAVTPDLVKKIRKEEEGKTTPLTVKDLIPLTAPSGDKPQAEAEAKPAEENKPEKEAEPEAETKPEHATKPAAATADAGKSGQEIYKQVCAACHGQNGEGLAPAFPPLAESEWVNGPAENLIRIQLHGLQGPIAVRGKGYNAIMPANAGMSDQEIASVLTYIRSSMGNSAPAVTPEMVSVHRDEAKANPGPLTVKDLIDPNISTATSITEPTALDGFKPAVSNGSSSVILMALGIIGICTLPAAAGLLKN